MSSKYSIIVGRGWLVAEIARALIENGYVVSIIDEKAEEHSRTYKDIAIYVYSSKPSEEILRKAGIDKAELVIAVDEDDENNYQACRVAKERGVPIVIARVNSIENIDKFNDLNIHTIITEYLVYLNVLKIMKSEFKNVLYRDSNIMVISLLISSDSPYIGFTVKEIEDKFNISIPYILRNGKLLKSEPDLAIEAEDTLIILGPVEDVVTIMQKVY